jgi:hypothetical protein
MTKLYRHFDKDGRLLYVGVSLSAIVRLASHKQASEWFDQVTTVIIETLPTREAALIAEKLAIQNEKPLYNIEHAEKVYRVFTATVKETFILDKEYSKGDIITFERIKCTHNWNSSLLEVRLPCSSSKVYILPKAYITKPVEVTTTISPTE